MTETPPPTPPEMWDTQPRPGRHLIYMDSKLASISLTVHPSREIDDRCLIIDGDVWFRATLRMVGWALSRSDLMGKLRDEGRITAAQSADFISRMDVFYEWVRASESFTDEELQWAWFNRAAQATFKPPFDHYREKYLPKKG